MDLVVIAGFSCSGRSKLCCRLRQEKFHHLYFKWPRLLASAPEDTFMEKCSAWASRLACMARLGKPDKELTKTAEAYGQDGDNTDNLEQCRALLKQVLDEWRPSRLVMDEDTLHKKPLWGVPLALVERSGDRAVYCLLETSYAVYKQRFCRRGDWRRVTTLKSEGSFNKMHAKAHEQFPHKDTRFDRRILCCVGLSEVPNVHCDKVLSYGLDEDYIEAGVGEVVKEILAAFRAPA